MRRQNLYDGLIDENGKGRSRMGKGTEVGQVIQNRHVFVSWISKFDFCSRKRRETIILGLNLSRHHSGQDPCISQNKWPMLQLDHPQFPATT